MEISIEVNFHADKRMFIRRFLWMKPKVAILEIETIGVGTKNIYTQQYGWLMQQLGGYGKDGVTNRDQWFVKQNTGDFDLLCMTAIARHIFDASSIA